MIEPSGRQLNQSGCSLQPRMVRRALDREVERDLEAVLARRGDEPAEIVERAELRDGSRRARPRRCRSRRGCRDRPARRARRIVAALAIGAADRMDRREIKHVEAHLAHVGQAGDHVVERAVPRRIAGLRARKQLVPAGELGLRPLDLDADRRMLHHEGVLGRRRNRRRCPGRGQRVDGRLHVAGFERLDRRAQRRSCCTAGLAQAHPRDSDAPRSVRARCRRRPYA